MDPVISEIHVSVNGQNQLLQAPATLADLVARLGHAPRAIATAVDGDFVAVDDRAQTGLRDGDRITCFQAIVGG